MEHPGEALNECRRSLGWSLEHAGRVLGCGHSTLSRIESGQLLPGRRLAAAIELLTSWAPGADVVRARDWDDLSDVATALDGQAGHGETVATAIGLREGA